MDALPHTLKANTPMQALDTCADVFDEVERYSILHSFNLKCAAAADLTRSLAIRRAVCEVEGLPHQDRHVLQKVRHPSCIPPKIALMGHMTTYPLPLQAMDTLFQRAIGSLQQSLLNFERLSAIESLNVPPELFLEQVSQHCNMCYAKQHQSSCRAAGRHPAQSMGPGMLGCFVVRQEAGWQSQVLPTATALCLY